MTFNSQSNRFLQFQTGANITGALDLSNIGVNIITFPDPLIDWLPKASQRKKYLPTWHLVRSYRCH